MQKISDVLAAIGKVCKGAAAKVIALVATMAMIGAVPRRQMMRRHPGAMP